MRPPPGGSSRVRTALASLSIGLLLMITAQRVVRGPSPPLYDGLPLNEPYVWLSPPPGQKGGAQGVSTTIPVEGGSSPLVAVPTPELDPQAQIFATPGALTLPPGTTSLSVSINPIPDEGQPADGHIAGNVYRIIVVNQDGAAVTAPASAEVTVVLRAPDLTIIDATIERFVAGAWQPLKTSPGGLGSSFVAVTTEFGDFALIVPGGGSGSAAPTSEAEASPSVAVPSTTPSPSVPAGPAGEGGSPSLLVGGLVLAVATVIGTIAMAARRRRRPTYWGARPPGRR